MSSDGDWLCSACQHVNFKKRDACQKCTYPRHGGVDVSLYKSKRTEVLAGDWFCAHCGAHNFASRSTCFRCGALKNDFVGGYGGNMTGNGCDGGARPGWKTGDWICTRKSHISVEAFVIPNVNQFDC
ncbi:Zinc finger, RanBP2-type [Dillenia turbinata]|uniref:Zinc finger, RanBP2-type n=1 Tax=Dillenia turbinata TaxID=194707 RepID=A0AAN8WAK7_9MAGN